MDANDDTSNRIEHIFVLIGVLIFIGVIAFFWFTDWSKHRLHAPQGSIKITEARTTKEQSLGLGNRDSLPNDEGMLFIFSHPSTQHCMWMKDMRFPIDIVWLNGDKRVVDIEVQIQPETYPEEFCSSKPAQYVLELNAGGAQKYGITNNTQIH